MMMKELEEIIGSLLRSSNEDPPDICEAFPSFPPQFSLLPATLKVPPAQNSSQVLSTHDQQSSFPKPLAFPIRRHLHSGTRASIGTNDCIQILAALTDFLLNKHARTEPAGHLSIYLRPNRFPVAEHRARRQSEHAARRFHASYRVVGFAG